MRKNRLSIEEFAAMSPFEQSQVDPEDMPQALGSTPGFKPAQQEEDVDSANGGEPVDDETKPGFLQKLAQKITQKK